MKKEKLQSIIQEEIRLILMEFTVPSRELTDLKKLFYDQKKIYPHDNRLGLLRDDKIAEEIKRILIILQKSYGGTTKKWPPTAGASGVSFATFVPEEPTGDKYKGTAAIVSLVKDPLLTSMHGVQSDLYYTIEYKKEELDAHEAETKYGSTMTEKEK